MALPFAYNLRSLKTRKLTTVLTSTGMAFVVFVFSSVMMMAEGLKKTLVDTGSPDNVVIIRRGSQSEVQSVIDRRIALTLAAETEIGTSRDGKPLVAKEVVVLITMRKKDKDKPSNVIIRGVTERSLEIREGIRLKEGRFPRSGFLEVAVGESIMRRFKDIELNGTLKFALREWRIVGIFDAGNTGFSSEIWAPVEEVMRAFRRPVYSSVIFRIRDPNGFNDFKNRIEHKPGLEVEAMREIDYYRAQSEVMSRFLRILGISLSIVFSIGAIIGAMITMYASVSNRIVEIGTLRALGFKKREIVLSFLLESIIISLVGGIVGIILSSFLSFLSISTLNWQTFSELAFRFTLTPEIIFSGIIFSIFMGITGGTLPALRAGRLNIVDALRQG